MMFYLKLTVRTTIAKEPLINYMTTLANPHSNLYIVTRNNLSVIILLEFEHIVQINDPQSSHIKLLNRQQLWEGLLLRARDPGKFNSSLSCRIEQVTDEGFMRFIQAGDSEFCEQVFLTHQEKIETITSGNDQSIYVESITSIEEPASGYLFVRFIYRRNLEDSREGQLVSEHLKSAYTQVDIDAIALIRLLAEDQLLEKKPN